PRVFTAANRGELEMCIDSPKLRKQPKGAVVGYRVFDYARERVHSLYWDEFREWTRGVNVTEDNPKFSEHNGFHALKTLQLAQEYRWLGNDRAGAKVRGSGVVVRHRSGFRSSRMTILRFYVDALFPKRFAAALRRVYRVPVEYLP